MVRSPRSCTFCNRSGILAVFLAMLTLSAAQNRQAAAQPRNAIPIVPSDNKAQLIETAKANPHLPVSPDEVEDAGDFYVASGNKIPLFRARQEAALVFESGVTPAHALAAFGTRPDLGMVTTISVHQRTSVHVVRAGIAKNARAVVSGTHLIETLARQPEIAQAYPVFVGSDDHARMIATDEILLCMKKGRHLADIGAQLALLGVSVIDKQPAKHIDVYRVKLTDTRKHTVLSACIEIAAWPQVEWAEPNWIRQIVFDYTPNDTYYSQQQSHHNTGQNGAIADADVDAPEVWDMTRGNSSLVIAIIDDGVDTSHADLVIQSGGYDFANGDSNPSPVGTNGHGTGCAGVAAAVINNSSIVAGIAGQCRILPVKIADDSGVFTTNDVIGNAILHAADRADILSNSWGGGGTSTYINAAIDYAIASGRAGKGSPVFFASGNSASGWHRGGGRVRLPPATLGLSGNYYIAFGYQKDGSGSVGLDRAYIDNVCLLNSTEYTHIWRQHFEAATFPPTTSPGTWQVWSSSGTNYWYRTATNALRGTAGTYSACSGAITHNQATELITPIISFAGSETLAFSHYVSSEAGYDVLYVGVYDTSWNWIKGWAWSGVPTVTTALSYPSSYTNSISVGASTDCDRRSDYSQYGASLDFVAPSNGGWNDIVTLDPTGSVGWTSTNYKKSFGGTSSACPLAAGVGALLLSRGPNLHQSQVRYILRNTADKVGGVTYTSGRHVEYGSGRINAYRAVRSLATVDAVAAPQPNRLLESWNDTQAEKMSVLKFRLTDRGQDGVPTRVDQMRIAITGTAGHGANDIAWAELHDGTAQVATAASITDTEIVFGSTQNADNVGQLDTVTDNSAVDYTLNIYLRPILQSAHSDTYIFDVDETRVGEDRGSNSSGMSGDTLQVVPVTGTIFVESLGIALPPEDESWALGAQPLGYVGESPTFNLTNTGNVAEDFSIRATNATNGWTLAANPASNAFAVDADTGDNGSYEFSLTSTDQLLAANIPVSGTANLGLRYRAPNADTFGGNVSHDFTVILTATRHE